MPLFSIKSDRLERVKEVSFKSERKDIQHTTESSLKEVFGFEFNDQYEVKLASTVEEAVKLVEVGFEYVTEMDGKKLFRKRK